MLDRLAITLHSWMQVTPIFAQNGEETTTAPTGQSEAFANIVPHMVLAILFTLVGMLLFGLSIWLIVKLAPFSVQKEIEEDQNTSLGIIMGSLILGVALILAAAIHG